MALNVCDLTRKLVNLVLELEEAKDYDELEELTGLLLESSREISGEDITELAGVLDGEEEIIVTSDNLTEAVFYLISGMSASGLRLGIELTDVFDNVDFECYFDDSGFCPSFIEPLFTAEKLEIKAICDYLCSVIYSAAI